MKELIVSCKKRLGKNLPLKKIKTSKFVKLNKIKIWNFSKKVSLAEQKNILYSLHLLLCQGYSLNESIKLVSYRLDLNQYIVQLSEGIRFSEILLSAGYDRDVLLIIEIAEESGQFASGIEKALAILDKKHKNKDAVWEQLKYPMMLGIIMILGIIFLSNFLIPTFQNVYEDFDIEISIVLKIIFGIIDILPKILGLIAIIAIAVLGYIQTREATARLGIFTKYKIFRTQYYKIYNQIFILNFTSLLELGMKLDEIFLILGNQNYNYLLQKESKMIIENLYQGVGLTEILQNQKIYNEDLIQIIEDGENNGTLVSNLKNYLLINELETKKKIEKYIFLVQPIFYGIFGLMIVFLYASMFIPMFAIMDSL